jgi:hypothetical protein
MARAGAWSEVDPIARTAAAGLAEQGKIYSAHSTVWQYRG